MFDSDATLLADEIKKYMGADANGVIDSPGIKQPCYPLSRIHLTVKADPLLYSKRNRIQQSEQVCPLGPPEAFRFEPNMLLFECMGGNAGYRANSLAPGKHAIAGFGDTVVFAAVNGLSRHAKLRFVGSSRTSFDPTNVNCDTAVTAAASGTITAINTGPTTLIPGKTAMFLATPYTVIVNGKIKPGIREKGVHPEMFRPMIVMADDLLGPQCIVRAQKACLNVLKGAGQINADEFNRLWRRARQEIRTVVIDRDLEEQARMDVLSDLLWIDQYLGWFLLLSIMTLTPAGNKLDEDDAKAVYTTLEQNHWNMADLGSYAEKLAVHAPTPFDSFAAGDPQKFLIHIQMRLAQAESDHRSQIAARCIGKITTLSPPGQPFDCVEGYFTA
jgi:hypothetical protein